MSHRSMNYREASKLLKALSQRHSTTSRGKDHDSSNRDVIIACQTILNSNTIDFFLILKPNFTPVMEVLHSSQPIDTQEIATGKYISPNFISLKYIIAPLLKIMRDLRDASQDEDYNAFLALCIRKNTTGRRHNKDKDESFWDKLVKTLEVVVTSHCETDGVFDFPELPNSAESSALIWEPTCIFDILFVVIEIFEELFMRYNLRVNPEWLKLAKNALNSASIAIFSYLKRRLRLGDDTSKEDFRFARDVFERLPHAQIVGDLKTACSALARASKIEIVDERIVDSKHQTLDEYLFGRRHDSKAVPSVIDNQRKRCERVKQRDDEKATDYAGTKSRYGVRHDNDDSCITDISLLPTFEEILCPRAEFLPRNDLQAMHFIHLDTDVDEDDEYGGDLQTRAAAKHIDIHFRLLRFNTLQPLKQGVLAFVQSDALTDTNLFRKASVPEKWMNRKTKHRAYETPIEATLINKIQHICPSMPIFEIKEDGGFPICLKVGASLNLYSNVRFKGLASRISDKPVYILEFEFAGLKGKSVKMAQEFWERGSELKYGSLVMLMSWSPPGRYTSDQNHNFDVRIESGVITDRNVNQTKRAQTALVQRDKRWSSTIGVSLPDMPLQDVISVGRRSDSRVYYMLQSSQGFFQASYPVLQNLQRIEPERLPFAKYIVSLDTIEKIEMPSCFRGKTLDLSRLVIKEKELQEADGVEYCKSTGAITRSRIGIQRDVNNKRSNYIIVKNDEDERRKHICQRLENFDAAKLNKSEFPFTDVAEFCPLDEFQLRSLVHLLGSELGLLQGPPGTGKTYIGVFLVLLLLDNRESIGNRPILVPTYTNHALDNFLIDLVKAGVNKLCRIGSQSKHEVLSPYNINELVKDHDIKRDLAYRAAIAHKQIETAEEDITRICRELEYELLSLDKLKDHILTYECTLKAFQTDTSTSQSGGYGDPELQGSTATSCKIATDDINHESFFLSQLAKSRAFRLTVNDMWLHWLRQFIDTEFVPSWMEKQFKYIDQRRKDVKYSMMSYLYSNDALYTIDEDCTFWWFQQTWVLHSEYNHFVVWDTVNDEYLLNENKLILWPRFDEVSGHPIDEDGEFVVFQYCGETQAARAFLEDMVNGGLRGRKTTTRRTTTDARNFEQLRNEWQNFASGDIFTKWSNKKSREFYLGVRGLFRQASIAALKEHIGGFQNACGMIKVLSEEKKVAVLRDMHVVGCTTNAAASNMHILKSLGCNVLIFEEAGEVLESHVLAILTRHTKILTMIGDHEQLRPGLEDFILSVENNQHAYNLDMSLFERLVVVVQMPYESLLIQRRMRPCIADLIRSKYTGLQDYKKVTEYPNLRGFRQNLVFFHHEHAEDNTAANVRSGQNTRSNEFEVRMIVRTVQYCLQQGYQSEQLVVLTPYVGQLLKLRAAFKETMHISVELGEKDQDLTIKHESLLSSEFDCDDEKDRNRIKERNNVKVTQKLLRIRLATIDNYQGEEADVVLISLVRNCGPPVSAMPDTQVDTPLDENWYKKDAGRIGLGNVGFLRTDNRTNVLLSRAKHGLIMLGNAAMLEYAAEQKAKDGFEKPGMWKPCIDLMRCAKRILPGLPIVCQNHPDYKNMVCQPSDFDCVSVDGGCMRRCGKRLTCGHVCPRKCHHDDIEHTIQRNLCVQPCPNICEYCENPCDKSCNQPCDLNCTYILNGPFKLPKCGHDVENITCWESRNLNTVKCPMEITTDELVPICGHACVKVSCETMLSSPGGDVTKNPTFECQHACTKELRPCGHKCVAGTCCVYEAYKKQIVFPSREHSKHPQAEVSTNLPTLQSLRDDVSIHPQCTVACKESLPCGHVCQAPCHAHERLHSHTKPQCPPCDKKCEVRCEHSTCPHRCSEQCTICVEPCGWKCKHQGSCYMPCGVPCMRLPCNKRCEERLPVCGHQCPTVCGEICPTDSAWCQECCLLEQHVFFKDREKMRACITARGNKDQVVDLITQKTLSEVNLDEDPLCILECRHALTISSLDGHMEMETGYLKQPQGGEYIYIGLKPFSSSGFNVKSCPLCRVPIQRVKRCGRIQKRALCEQAQTKFVVNSRRLLADLKNAVNANKQHMNHIRHLCVEQEQSSVKRKNHFPAISILAAENSGDFDPEAFYEDVDTHYLHTKKVYDQFACFKQMSLNQPTRRAREVAITAIERRSVSEKEQELISLQPNYTMLVEAQLCYVKYCLSNHMLITQKLYEEYETLMRDNIYTDKGLKGSKEHFVSAFPAVWAELLFRFEHNIIKELKLAKEKSLKYTLLKNLNQIHVLSAIADIELLFTRALFCTHTELVLTTRDAPSIKRVSHRHNHVDSKLPSKVSTITECERIKDEFKKIRTPIDDEFQHHIQDGIRRCEDVMAFVSPENDGMPIGYLYTVGKCPRTSENINCIYYF